MALQQSHFYAFRINGKLLSSKDVTIDDNEGTFCIFYNLLLKVIPRYKTFSAIVIDPVSSKVQLTELQITRQILFLLSFYFYTYFIKRV